MTRFEQEIREQPAVLAAILADEAVARVAAELRSRDVRLVLTLARGSSDNAVTFFIYLAARHLGLPVASLPPSLFTLYGTQLDVEGALAIGVSQSGESSDVVEGLATLQRAGIATVAVSNRPGSSLERVADHALRQNAGEERAVAASKTFSSQMMVLASLVAQWSQRDELATTLAGVPAHMERQLGDLDAVERAALRLTHAEQAHVLGRGLSYGPALELALKLKETSYLHAQAYSSAEFQHGPIASVDAGEPVLLLALEDATLDSNRTVARRLAELGADLTVVSGDPELLALAEAAVPLPAGLAPAAGAFLQVLIGQLLALRTAESKRLDPDSPRHLNKVTRTL